MDTTGVQDDTADKAGGKIRSCRGESGKQSPQMKQMEQKRDKRGLRA